MHARNTPPLRIPLQEIWKWATETLNLLLTTSLRKKAHKVWRHHLLSETLQDGALPCLSAGWDHGEGSMAFQEYQPDRTTPVRKNTLSNRKHLLRQCLIIYHPNDNTYIFCHAPGCKRLRWTCVWYMGSKEQDLTKHLPPDLRSP